MRIINRALGAEEIEELAAKEKRIRFVPESAVVLSEKIRASIDAFRKKFASGAQSGSRAFADRGRASGLPFIAAPSESLLSPCFFSAVAPSFLIAIAPGR